MTDTNDKVRETGDGSPFSPALFHLPCFVSTLVSLVQNRSCAYNRKE